MTFYLFQVTDTVYLFLILFFIFKVISDIHHPLFLYTRKPAPLALRVRLCRTFARYITREICDFPKNKCRVACFSLRLLYHIFLMAVIFFAHT